MPSWSKYGTSAVGVVQREVLVELQAGGGATAVSWRSVPAFDARVASRAATARRRPAGRRPARQAAAPVRMFVHACRAGSAARSAPARPRPAAWRASQAARPTWRRAASTTAPVVVGRRHRPSAAPLSRKASQSAARSPTRSRLLRLPVRPPARSSCARHSRSRPDHQPATVGRSCVLVIAAAALRPVGGRSEALLVALEPQHAHAQHAGVGQLGPGSRRERCRGPRPARSRGCAMRFQRDQPQHVVDREVQVGAVAPAPRRPAPPRAGARPIAWSMRTPPAWRIAARSISMKAREAVLRAGRAARTRPAPNPGRAVSTGPAARRRSGRSASRPAGSSNGCRRDRRRPRGRRSGRSACRRRALPPAPPPGRGRRGIADRRAARPRRACARANAATSALSGSRQPAGQSRQCQRPSAAKRCACSASNRACASSVSPSAARNALEPPRIPPALALERRPATAPAAAAHAAGQSTSAPASSAAASPPRSTPHAARSADPAGWRIGAEAVEVGGELRMHRADRDRRRPMRGRSPHEVLHAGSRPARHRPPGAAHKAAPRAPRAAPPAWHPCTVKQRGGATASVVRCPPISTW